MGRPLRVEDIHALELPSSPTISPDGSRVVYVLRTTDVAADADRFALWTVGTGPDAVPIRLTRGERDNAPAFAPDGAAVAFLRPVDGVPQVHRVPVAGGEAEQLTTLATGAGAPVWSPDGTRIAFSAPVDTSGSGPDEPIVIDRLAHKADGAGLLRGIRTHLHVLDVAAGTVEQVTSGNWNAGAPAWSPDGTALAFAAATEPDADLTLRSAAYVIDVSGSPGEPRRIGPADGTAGLALWSGEHLIVTGTATVTSGHLTLMRIPLAGGAAVDLTAVLDRNVMPGGPGYPGGRPQLTPDGQDVVFCIRDRGCTHVYATAADGSGTPRALVRGADVVVSGVSVAAAADVAAVVVGDSGAYGEIGVVDLASGMLTRLTAHTASSLPDVELLKAQEREFTLSDGSVVHGWLLRDPAATGAGPLLLDIHGGPHNAWHPAADAVHPYHQVLAAGGWSVLTLNVKASDGYGKAHYTATVGSWGIGDERDFLEPLDQLVADGVADPARLAVGGYSYGGYMTCWLTTRTDRFAAAMAGGVVADLTSIAGTSDVGPLLAELEFGTQPHADRELLRSQSPIERVEHVTTPTLILHGLADERCPAGQAEQWFSALRSRGVPAQLVFYPGSSHLFILDGRPSHRADYSKRYVDWTRTLGRRPIDAGHWQRRLTELAERFEVPGAGLGILRLDTHELVEAATGVLCKDTGVEVTTDSVFQMGSIGKTWTATVVMQLVDEGLLDLDAPIIDVLPDFRVGDAEVTKQVTMRHLLTHSSGIEGDVFTDTGRGDDCLERYVRELGDVGQNHPLGVTFSYCNSGFNLAGRVIEVVTGKTWDTAMRERLFDPLGLTHTSTLPEELLRHRAAMGHVAEPGEEFRPAPVPLLPRSAGPAGLINTTPRDMLEYVRMHLRGGVAADGTRVLSEASTALMQESHVELPDVHTLGDSWGLGWIRFGWDGRRVFGHDGNTIGQSAFLRIVPDAGVAVVLLTNGGHTKDLYHQLYREILAEVAGLAKPAPLQPPAEPPAFDPARHVGTYERTSARTEMIERAGGLVMRMTATGEMAAALGATTREVDLVPVAEDLFAFRGPDEATWTPVTFYRLPDGREYVHYGVRANPKVEVST